MYKQYDNIDNFTKMIKGIAVDISLNNLICTHKICFDIQWTTYVDMVDNLDNVTSHITNFQVNINCRQK